MAKILKVTISDRLSFALTGQEELVKYLQVITTVSLPPPGRPVRGVEREDASYCPVILKGRLVTLPRGLSRVLAQACRERGIGMEVVNEVVSDQTAVPADLDAIPLKPRDYQKQIIDLLIRHKQGWICLPCGGGKTTTGALAAIATGQPALVVVHTKDLQDQWIATFRRAGVQARPAENQAINAGEVVVGIVQGLKSCHVLLSSVGCLILDECHHVPANSFLDIIDQCPARYRWGFTATPKRADGKGFLLDMIFGSCLFTMTAKELIDLGFLLRPTIIPVLTGWSPTKEHFRWFVECECGGVTETNWVSWRVNKNATCSNVIFETGPRGGKNRRVCALPLREDIAVAKRGDLEFAATLTALSENAERIALIAKLGSWTLLSRRRLLVLVARKGAAITTCGVLRGAGLRASAISSDVADREGRIRALRLGYSDGLVATSLADEGLDIPELDTVISANPSKDSGKAQQRAGRACRPAGKPPIIFDLVDDHHTFTRHWKHRKEAYIEAYGRECMARTEPVSVEMALQIAAGVK